jgi:hypothetical protein
MEDLVTVPITAIKSRSPYVGSGSDGHLSRSQERAYIWRHPELIGVELFRGVYRRYQAARHFHLGPASGIVAEGAMNSYARGATHTLPSGTVFLINPEEVHSPGPVIPHGWCSWPFTSAMTSMPNCHEALGSKIFAFLNFLYGTSY